MKRIEEFHCSSFFTSTTLSMKIRPLTGKRIPLRYTGIKKRTICEKKMNVRMCPKIGSGTHIRVNFHFMKFWKKSAVRVLRNRGLKIFQNFKKKFKPRFLQNVYADFSKTSYAYNENLP